MAITVRESKANTSFVIKDALGRIREGWAIMDGNGICGIYPTKDAAEKSAESLKQIRFASR